jgi:hypothetical protein
MNLIHYGPKLSARRQPGGGGDAWAGDTESAGAGVGVWEDGVGDEAIGRRTPGNGGQGAGRWRENAHERAAATRGHESMRGSMRESTRESMSDREVGWTADQGAPRMRGLARPGWRRLGFRRQFVLMLVAATLLCTVGMVAAAYMGARANAIGMAQAREAQDLRVAWQVLGTHGSSVLIQKGQLQTGSGYVINGDHAVVDQITALAGDQAAIYEMENNQLVLVASDLHTGASSALGTTLGGSAYQAVLGDCLASPAATSDCHAGYRGPVTIGRTGYIAAVVPLMDAQGTLVGALEVATPTEAIEAPLRTLAGLLLLIGLAAMALFIVIGFRVSNPVSRRAFTALAAGLDGIDGVAARLGIQARTQASRAGRQAISARHLTDELRTLNELATAIENGAAMLQQATGGVWAELSHPGAQVDAQTCLRTARHAAVVGGQLGVAAEQAFELCRRMRTTVNHLIAESGALCDSGGETARAATDLRDALERAEAALGNRSVKVGAVGGSVAAPHSAGEDEGGRLDGVKALASPALAALGALVARLGGARDDDEADDEADDTAADHGEPDAAGARFAHATNDAAALAGDEEHRAVRMARRTRPIDLPPDASGDHAGGHTVLGSAGAWLFPGSAPEAAVHRTGRQTGPAPATGQDTHGQGTPAGRPRQTVPTGEHHAPGFWAMRAPRPGTGAPASPRTRMSSTSVSNAGGAPMGGAGRRPTGRPGDPAAPANSAHPANLMDPARTGPAWRTPTAPSPAADGPTAHTPGPWDNVASDQRGHAPGSGQWPNQSGH